MQGLYNTHCRAPCPVKTTGSSLSERNHLVAKFDRSEAIVRKDHHTSGNCRGEAEIVSCRQSILDEAGLIAPRNSVDHGASIRCGGSPRKFVEARCVV